MTRSLASLSLIAAVALAGCSSDPSTSASFQPSTTAPTPGLVKLEQKSLTLAADRGRLHHTPFQDENLARFRIDLVVHNDSRSGEQILQLLWGELFQQSCDQQSSCL